MGPMGPGYGPMGGFAGLGNPMVLSTAIATAGQVAARPAAPANPAVPQAAAAAQPQAPAAPANNDGGQQQQQQQQQVQQDIDGQAGERDVAADEQQQQDAEHQVEETWQQEGWQEGYEDYNYAEPAQYDGDYGDGGDYQSDVYCDEW